MLTWISLLLVGAIYAAWRIDSTKKARERFLKGMPPTNQLSWRPLRTKVSQEGAFSTLNSRPGQTVQDDVKLNSAQVRGIAPSAFEMQLPGVAAAAIDSAIAGLPVVEAIGHIDTSVLKAIEFSTSEHLHNLASINDYVHDHFFAVPLQSADGWFERLTGYVTEQKAASTLEAMGHHVEFAPVANQPVWDLIVDGHHVQVKEGLAGVKEFLASHPGIPVYTSYENAAAAKDPLVHGLAQLGSGQIHEATSQSLDGINDAFDPGFHFPVVTLAFSSWREMKLLWDEMTTIDRALKNVGMDVVGVAGGAFAGTKAGVLAGALIGGPIGAAVGGFLGAILGGISGKMASTSIRYAPFSKAKDEYNESIVQAQAEVQNSIRSSQTMVGNLETEYQAKFLASRNRIEQLARDEIARLTNGVKSQITHFAEAFPGHLDELIAQLKMEEQEVLRRVPIGSIWGFLVPSNTDHYRAAVKIWFQRARKIVEEEKLRYSKVEIRTGESLYAEIRRFLSVYKFELDALEKELGRLVRTFDSSRQEAQLVHQNAVREMEQHRTNLIQELSRNVEVIHAQIVKLLQRWNGSINSRKAQLVKEGRFIGIKIPSS